MRFLKRSYVGTIHAVAAMDVTEGFFRWARRRDAAGWARWLASLLVLHNAPRMMALDVPWWNVRATRQAEIHLKARSSARVFEYGAGASTAWLAQRARHVISVEHNPEWLGVLQPMLGGFGNVELWHRALESEAYPGAIAEAGGSFDMIVIDGRRRVECLGRALPHLAPDGIVLFDDSGRERYREGINGSGLHERHYFGRSYCVPFPDRTSILRR